MIEGQLAPCLIFFFLPALPVFDSIVLISTSSPFLIFVVEIMIVDLNKQTGAHRTVAGFATGSLKTYTFALQGIATK